MESDSPAKPELFCQQQNIALDEAKSRCWDSWRTVMLAEDEAAIREMLLFHHGHLIGAVNTPSPPEEGEVDVCASMTNPELNSATQVCVCPKIFWKYGTSLRAMRRKL